MTSTDKQHVFQMAKIAAAKGLRHVVVSPGSRSAPLVIAFNRIKEIQCYPIADERCAAFVALGMAQQSGEPVGLICTSGSAVLNYAPAISEAFYQKIPLIIMTADRPNETIDQGENQSINQFEIYKNYIKKSYELPVDTDDSRDLWYSARLVNEALNLSQSDDPGPVHINVPLREPLYNLKEYSTTQELKIISPIASKPIVIEEEIIPVMNRWENYQRKLIIVGTHKLNKNLNYLLETLANREDIVVFTENTSNQFSPYFIQCIDPMIDYIQSHPNQELLPDLVVTIGGGLISKKIKFAFKNFRIQEHWHISISHEHWDNFQALSHIFPISSETFLQELTMRTKEVNSNFNQTYRNIQQKLSKFHEDYLTQIPFSDFSVFDKIHRDLPNNTIIFYGNSTPIRYGNLFNIPNDKNISVYANRGVSGIDGVVSTAAGGSMMQKDKIQLCIVGDISFFYDSNAWWNKFLGENFKCILINNQGGNIFKIIPGPDSLEELDSFFETKHSMNAYHIAKQFDINYHKVSAENELDTTFNIFIQEKNGRPSLLEINTPNDSSQYLRKYFQDIKNI